MPENGTGESVLYKGLTFLTSSDWRHESKETSESITIAGCEAI